MGFGGSGPAYLPPPPEAPTITDEDVQTQKAILAAALRRKRGFKSLKYEPSRTLLAAKTKPAAAAAAAMETGGTLLWEGGGGSVGDTGGGDFGGGGGFGDGGDY